MKSKNDLMTMDLFDFLPEEEAAQVGQTGQADPPVLAVTPASASVLDRVDSLRKQGWLRRLDVAFARFLRTLSPEAPDELVLAATLLVHMEGQGHTCLDMVELLDRPQEMLGWSAEADIALHEVLQRLPGHVSAWEDAVASSPLVQVDADDNTPSGTPLILQGSVLYLRRYWHEERRVAAQISARSRVAEVVDTVVARRWLDLLFPPNPALGFDWQKAACAVALRSRLSILTGGPGTGKTYTAARLLALLFAVDPAPQRMRVALAAPTGKAAARLRQSIEASLGALQGQLGDRLPLGELTAHVGAARTLHSLLGARSGTRVFGFDAAHPLDIDVLLVDEASMIHLEMMAALLDALPPRARIVFMGDKDQLASVEAGAVLGDLCRHAKEGHYRPETVAYLEATCGQVLEQQFQRNDGLPLAQQTVMLRESQRFGGAIGQLALAVNRGDVETATRLLRTPPDVTLAWVDSGDAGVAVRLALHGRNNAAQGYGTYIAALQNRPPGDEGDLHAAWTQAVLREFDKFRVLCAVREGDWGAMGLNRAIERALVHAGSLLRNGEWYEGRPILVTRNDPGLGVLNGDIGIALRPAAQGAPLRAYFLDGESVKSVAVSRLAHVETAFAMTVHKSQGSEFRHTMLVLPRHQSGVLTRELIYTGITRAKSAFTLATGRAAGLFEAVSRPTRRTGGLQQRLGSV